MAVYSEWVGDPDLPLIPWDTLIRWGAVVVVLLLPAITLWCLSRPVTWLVERWWP